METSQLQQEMLEIDRTTQHAWDNRKSELRVAFDASLDARSRAEELGYDKGVADACKMLGYCYWRFSEYANSMECSLRALELYKKIGDLKGEADTLNSIGAVYMFRKDHVRRLECNMKCLELRQSIGDQEEISGSMNNIGETYFEMGDLDNAVTWFEKCIDHKSKNQDALAWAHHNLGRVGIAKEDLNQARSSFKQSLEITESINYHAVTIENYLYLCKMGLQEGDFISAKNYALSAFKESNENGLKEGAKDALLALANITEEAGDLKESLQYYKKYHELYVHVFNAESSEKLKDLGFQYELDKVREVARVEREKNLELAKANKEIEQQNQDIRDSILYAKRIQFGLLKPLDHVTTHLPEHAIIFKPKDIVSGDFYWTIERDGYWYMAVADCTGHGVPGAFLTLLGTSFLNEISLGPTALTPAEIMDRLRQKFISELGDQEGEFRDGMDISMIRLELDTLLMDWAGAISPLWINRKGSLSIEAIAGDKQSICYTENPEPFTDQQFQMKEGDLVYLFSDGFPDQFGGERGKKLKRSNMLKMFRQVEHLPPHQQKVEIEKLFQAWQGSEEQVDDICVLLLRF